jgi:oxygen-dependent protoporphyrinogen oxidase
VILKLARDVGLESSLVFADAKLPRYVFWDGVLHALPASPADLVNGRFRLLTNAGKFRAALGALGFVAAPKRATENGNHASAEASDLLDESVEAFVTRHLGREVFLKLIDPFVSGVYAGDPSKLSMAAAFKRVYALEQLGGTRGILEGALIRLQQRRRERKAWAAENLPPVKSGALGSFRQGLQQLPLTIQQLLGPERMRTNHRLRQIEFHGQQSRKRRYTAFFDTPNGERIIQAETLILTVPAYVASPLLQKMGVAGSQLLQEIESPPVYSVTLAYPKHSSRFPLWGFGNLIPRSAGIRTLGMVWSSSLFPERAPSDMHMVLSYIGGARDQAIQQCTKDEVVQQVDADMRRILLRADAPSPRVLGVRLWPRAIPQYTRGHLRRLSECNRGLERFPGLYVGGNYVSGVSFGDCVQWAYDNIPRVLSSLQKME